MIAAQLGQTFGRWTLVEFLPRRPKDHHRAVFRCSCGTTQPREVRTIVHGASLSCGCLRRDQSAAAIAAASKRVDFTDDEIASLGERRGAVARLLRDGRDAAFIAAELGMEKRSAQVFAAVCFRRVAAFRAGREPERRSGYGKLLAISEASRRRDHERDAAEFRARRDHDALGRREGAL